MNLLGQFLFSSISICLLASTAIGQDDLELGIPNEDKEILDVQTPTELRSILNDVRQNLQPSQCTDWNEKEDQVAAVFDLQKPKGALDRKDVF